MYIDLPARTPLPSSARMAKYRLEEKVVPKVKVFGLSSHVPDYRLCWSLNRSLGLDLARREKDIVDTVGGRPLHYAVFEQRNEDLGILWSLVSNLCGKRRLIAEPKEADYFLVADAELIADEKGMIERLRKIELVLTAFPVDISALKMGHKLLL